MGIYIALLVSAILGAILEKEVSYIRIGNLRFRTKAITFVILFIFILLLGIFRAEIFGVDQENYREYFYYWKNQSYVTIFSQWRNLDIFYYALGKFVAQLGLDFYGFKVVIYLLVWGIIGTLIWKYSDVPAFSFLMLMGFGQLFMSFVILRQSLALAFCLVAYTFARKKKLKGFIAFLIIACLFHKTSIFFVFTYLFANDIIKSYSFIKRIALIVVSIVASIVLVPLLYVFYSNDYSQVAVQGDGLNLLVISVFIAFLSSYLEQSKKKDINSFSIGNVSLTWAVVYFQIIAVAFSLFTRVTQYYLALYPLCLPDLIKKSYRGRYVYYVLIVIASVLFAYSLTNSTLVPYRTIFMR